MQFKVHHEVLTQAFIDSVNSLLDELIKEKERVFEQDPDADNTWAHHMDKMLRKWFNSGGGLGYR